MKNIHRLLWLPLIVGLALGQCSNGSDPQNPSGNEEEPRKPPIASRAESNIIYNGNMDMFVLHRWASETEENENKRKAIVRHLKELGAIGSRESVWNSYGKEKIAFGEEFDLSYNDRMFAELKESGLGYVLQMKVDAIVVNPDDYGPQWEKNAVWYITKLAERYGSQPIYYCPTNEPENPGQRIKGVEALTTEQIVRVQQVVYETLKRIDPRIMVATSPLVFLHDRADPPQYASDSRQVLLAGITRYCDYFAFHKHGDIGDDGSRSEMVLWDLMDEAERAGYPRKPAVINENGSSLTLMNVFPQASEEQARQFKAYWAGLDLIQMKALGLKYIVQYSLTGSRSRNGEYNIVDDLTAVGDGYKVHEKEYEVYKSLWNPQAHLIEKGINGGFEQPEPDMSRGWVTVFRGRPWGDEFRTRPKEWDYVSIAEERAGAFNGNRYLRMEPIDYRWITGNRCRRLVEGLVPGANYRLTARIRLDGSAAAAPQATLRALGFDPLGKERAETTITFAESDGQYVEREVTFEAVNPWVVISLEHNGKGTASWDEISLELR